MSLYQYWPLIFRGSKATMNKLTVTFVALAVLQNAMCLSDKNGILALFLAFTCMFLPFFFYQLIQKKCNCNFSSNIVMFIYIY